MRSLGVSLAALLCLAAPAAANVYSGSLSDDTTGPIPAGVHMVVNHIAVQAGKTLTVQAGAVLKFTGGYWLDIYGQLLVQGASGSEVIFTSYPDDSAGGDTNGNGPSSGSPGQWCGIFLEAASGPNLFDHARVRYAGYAGYDAVRIHGAGVALTMTDSVLEMSSADGLDLLNHLNYPTVSNCQFNNNAGRAVEGLCIDAVPGFTDNSASGNGCSYMNVTNPNVQGTALTIEAQN
ncbi:MAG: hypothetical protein HY812_21835, partial [Planctomycetes bacterium]|nr:hypothetical protein [Planctomycetota bacterium]